MFNHESAKNVCFVEQKYFRAGVLLPLGLDVYQHHHHRKMFSTHYDLFPIYRKNHSSVHITYRKSWGDIVRSFMRETKKLSISMRR